MSNASYYVKSSKNDSDFDVDINNDSFAYFCRHNGSNQKLIPNNIEENVYIFSVEYNNSLVMTAPSNSSEEKLKLTHWDRKVDDKWQQFKLIDNYDGSFKIQNVGSNFYLEVKDTRNCVIHLNKVRNDRQQLFYFEKAQDKS
jgi:hypothetical protein